MFYILTMVHTKALYNTNYIPRIVYHGSYLFFVKPRLVFKDSAQIIELDYPTVS